MLNKGSIQFYINGPPPLARLINATTEPSLLKLLNSQDNATTTPSQNQEPLNLLIHKTQDTLLTVRSMWLLDLFPDKLTVDEAKVSFIYNSAFGVKSIHSVLIENITYVEAHTSLLSGSLIIVDSSNYRHPVELKIENLRKEAAIRARKLIQGLIHAKNLKIDISQFTPYDLENNMEELGRITGED